MSPIFISGAAGNLGRLLTDRLAASGQSIVAFDLHWPAGHTKTTNSIHQISGDICDNDLIRNVLQTHRPSAIIHLASLLSGSSEADPAKAWEVNADATAQLMQAALETECGPFVFASTVGTYGRGLPRVLPEDAPQWPENIYGATKVAVERLGYYHKCRHGLDFRCLRFPMVLSPFAPVGALSAYPSHAFRAAAEGQPFTFPVSPDTGMSTLFIGDVVRSLALLSQADKAALTSPAYNLHGFHVTADEIAQALIARYPAFRFQFEPNIEIDELIRDAPDRMIAESARAEWGWQPEFDFAACAAALFDYFETGNAP